MEQQPHRHTIIAASHSLFIQRYIPYIYVEYSYIILHNLRQKGRAFRCWIFI